MGDTIMGLFDPVAVNRQIDQIAATIPQGKTIALIGHVDVATKKFSLSVAVRKGPAEAFVRVGKPLGKGAFEADAGIKVSFLVDQPDDDWGVLDIADLLIESKGLNTFRALFEAVRIRHFGKPFVW